jgi:hypothetical protein
MRGVTPKAELALATNTPAIEGAGAADTTRVHPPHRDLAPIARNTNQVRSALFSSGVVANLAIVVLPEAVQLSWQRCPSNAAASGVA